MLIFREVIFINKLYDKGCGNSQKYNQRLLIISNNVLSTTKNNGKTIYSYICKLPENHVAQLYFSAELPEMAGYFYYQLSDRSILKGIFGQKYRGAEMTKLLSDNRKENISGVCHRIPRNMVTMLLRELLWRNKWHSTQLDDWLDKINPDVVLFVAGDCLFPYAICKYVVKRYKCRLGIYVTDDYILPRSYERFPAKMYRMKIKETMRECLNFTDAFFTVSEKMRKKYRSVLRRDSFCIVNLSESLRNEKLQKRVERNQPVIFIYTGSLYYGREKTILAIAKEMEKYNLEHDRKAVLELYLNEKPEEKILKMFHNISCIRYRGRAEKEQLKVRLNMCNILVFAESFQRDQIEKVKYSLSTKIPEYLSLGKPVFAVGSGHAGAMEYLKDAAVCISHRRDIYHGICVLMNSAGTREYYASAALEKYKKHFNIEKQRHNFMKHLLGIEEKYK